MNHTARHIILFILLLNLNSVSAQNITGTWEGTMGHEWIQINIKTFGNNLCGYTYDHFLNDKREHCKAWFTGSYNPVLREWVITGQTFIENSGSHVLMRLWLWREISDNSNTLSATVTTELGLGLMMPNSMGEQIALKRTSRKPTPLPGGQPICYPEPEKPKPPVVKKPLPKPKIPEQRSASPQIKPKPNVIQMPDTIKRRQVTPIVKERKEIPVTQKMIARKRNAISRLEVNVKHITLAVYDNGIIDGDTVSIFFNGKLVVNKQLLSARPLTIELELNENIAENEILMYAENLGSIPPNTALVVVTAGDKRYELYSSASLEENAVLVFDYKPK